jgi:hypothetical protein
MFPGGLSVIAGLIVVLLALGLFAPARAEEQRLDLFDQKRRRTGHVIVDRESGRVDFYDRESRRTGWGSVTPSCTVKLFDLEGRRLPESVRPWCREGGHGP